MAKIPFPEVPAGDHCELLRELHDLHARAGWPSTRALAEQQPFSHTVVHELFVRFDQPPKLPVLMAVVQQLADLAPRARADDLLDRFDRLWVTLTSASNGAPNIIRNELPEFKHALLLPLLGLANVDAESVRRMWRRTASSAHPLAPLGYTDRGVFVLDLVDDGPHLFICGTTGSGKSELLRSMVASLAVGTDPSRINFVLIDFKGGAAFGACSKLPHTLGLLTELNEELGERVIARLHYELRNRQRRLLDAGVSNIVDYSRLPRVEPIPRLVVIVEELSTVSQELSEFIDALIAVTRRGGPLGIHLVMATQRTAHCMSREIREHARLRIALRTVDVSESWDAIDAPLASEIDRGAVLRGYLRVGAGEPRQIQVAWLNDDAEGRSALDLLVAAMRAAVRPEQVGVCPPWPP